MNVRKLARKQKTLSFSFRQSSRGGQLLGGASRVQRDEGSVLSNESKTFSYFLVLGIPPSTPAEEMRTGMAPQLLYKFPEDAELPVADITSFCYPAGNIPISRVGGPESLVQLYRTVFSHDCTEVDAFATSFAFLFTVGISEQRLLYGVCVTYEEIVCVPPSFMRKSYDELEGSLQEESSFFIAPRCFCMLSEFPFFKPHLSVLKGIVSAERHNADVLLHKVMAKQLETLSQRERGDSISDPVRELPSLGEYIAGLMIVDQYYNLAVPPPERVANCVLQTRPQEVKFTFQTGSERELLADWCIPMLAQMFTFKEFLTFFAALMLEMSVLVISKDLNSAAAVIMSAIPLLHPIVWQGPMIPILPSNMVEYLDAPVPSLIGTCLVDVAKKAELADHCLIMDCDSHLVTAPKMKRLPNRSKLDDLRKPYQLLASKQLSATEQARVVRQFLLGIRVYHNLLEEVVISSIIEAGVELTDRVESLERAAAAAPSGWSDFLREIFQVQHYVMYVYGIQQGISEKQASMQGKWGQVMEKIKEAEEELMQLDEIIRVHVQKREEVRSRLAALAKVKAALQASDPPAPKK